MDDLRVVMARIEAGVEALQVRMDDHRSLTERQHADNTGRLASIEREVRTTNGRVNGHDTRLSMHEQNLTSHEQSISSLRRAAGLTITEILRYVGCIAGTYMVMKALGLLK